MAIISSYPYDQTITDSDAWVGTDSINRQTKQYTARAVADYLNINGKVAIAGMMNYKFVKDPSIKTGTFAFAGGSNVGAPWSSITSVVISNTDLSSQNVSPFFEYLINEQIMFQDISGKGSFGHYTIKEYTKIGTSNFYTLTLEYIGGNGSIAIDHYYTLVNFYLEKGDGKVETINTSNTTFINTTPTQPTTGEVVITASLSANGTPDDTKFLRGDNTWAEADKKYVHDQGIPSLIWTINHGLNKYPSVSAVDTAGSVVFGQVDYIDTNNLTITFNASFSGEAYLN